MSSGGFVSFDKVAESLKALKWVMDLLKEDCATSLSYVAFFMPFQCWIQNKTVIFFFLNKIYYSICFGGDRYEKLCIFKLKSGARDRFECAVGRGQVDFSRRRPTALDSMYYQDQFGSIGLSSGYVLHTIYTR